MQQVGQVSVRRAERAEHSRAAEALAAAFVDDPAWSWLLPYADRRARLRRFFETELRHLVPDRREIWTTEDGSGAAFWAPPGRWRVPFATVVGETLPMSRVFGRRLPLALRYLFKVEHLHPHDPHWYLEIIGTEPNMQGKGLGSALFRPVLALCDRDGLGAYLEASSERSRALYERHGFKVVERFNMPGGGPEIRRMWRDPRP